MYKYVSLLLYCFFCFKQKTAYEMRISDWSSDVCSSDLWGCGFIPEKWVPTTTGSDYAMPADLAPLEPYRDRLAILSGYDVKLDGVPNKPHITGCLGLRTDRKSVV